MVEFTYGLLQDMPRKLKDAFDYMSPDNTPPTIFNFIIFYIVMIKEIQTKLELLKKDQANNVA